jgi:hypothetical protein
MMNVGRCTVCGAFLIGEQAGSHKCEIHVKEAKDIYFQWLTDGITDKNGDLVRTGLAYDGTLYGLYLCKHNPPCSVKSRWIRGPDESSECSRNKPPPDNAIEYPIGGYPELS